MRCSIKKVFFFFPCLCIANIGWIILDKKFILARALIFLQLILLKIRTGSSLLEFRCSDARNKLRTEVLPRIFNHSTEYLSLPDHCMCLTVSSLKIRKNTIIFPGSKQKRQSGIHNFASTLLFSTERLFFSAYTALSRTLPNRR